MTLHAIKIFMVVLMVLGAATRVMGDDDHERESETDRSERETVRAAVERGELKPLSVVLQAVQSKLPGEVVGIEIEREQGVWIYEFRVAGEKGRLFDVYVDAATAQILKTKEK
ncbi:PepSY domain-containing protein [Hyphomicrobium sp. 99]|uniref:PepSY domain-containing protein n=1 Tax=Hyphomicrobium sp. 99 TaxID=1163419 RepID=UPI0006987E31|nr:PepSY domain-containing protein [Hyphomicrobium sp. 99]